jgi:chromosome segregation ATPase
MEKSEWNTTRVELENKVESLNAELMELQDRQISQRQNESENKSQIDRLQQNLTDTEVKCTDLENQVVSLNDMIDVLNLDLVETKGKYKSLQQLYKELSTEKDKINAEMQEILDNNSKSILKYEQTAEELKTIQKEVTSLTSTNIKLEQQNATKEREKGELLTQFMTLEDQKANLQNCNDALQLEVSTRMHN